MVKVKGIFFVILSIIICNSCATNPKKYYNHYVKGLSIKGLVIKKYLDRNHHMYPIIRLRDSAGLWDYNPVRFYQLYETVQKGDSIMKQKGSLEYRIYRSDTVIKLYPVIDGDTLK